MRKLILLGVASLVLGRAAIGQQATEWTVGDQTYQVVRSIPGYDLTGVYDFAFGPGGRLALQSAGAGRLAIEGQQPVRFRWGILALANGEPAVDKSDGGARYTLIVSYTDSFHVAARSGRQLVRSGTVDEMSLVLRPAEKKIFIMGIRPRPLGASEAARPTTGAWAVWQREAVRTVTATAAPGAGTAVSPSAGGTQSSFADAVKQDVTQALAEQAAKGGVSAADARMANNIVKGVEIASALSADRADKKAYEARISEATSARGERLAAGADVVGFQRPIRPSPTDTVHRGIHARILNYGFDIKTSKNAHLAAFDITKYNSPPVEVGVGHASKDLVFAGATDRYYLVFVMKMKTTFIGTERVVVSCNHYAPNGELMIRTEGVLPPKPSDKPRPPKEYEFNWISRIMSKTGWQPGAYGVECATDGLPVVNATIDLR